MRPGLPRYDRAVLRARRRPLVPFVFAALLAGVLPARAATLPPPGDPLRARPAWAHDLDAIIGDRPFSVSVGEAGEVWYEHKAWVMRPPASNQKLLLSMVLLDRYAPGRRIATEVRHDGRIDDGVLRGDLWLVGHGDPDVDRDAIRAIASEVEAAGIRRIAGSVMGATGPFERDWWAPGWREYFPDIYIARPTALTFDLNESATGQHLSDPERRAAQALTGRLRARRIVVRDDAGYGSPGGPTDRLAVVRSRDLLHLMRRMNVPSSNFRAEVLGKMLAFEAGKRGTIAAGAKVVCGWIVRRGPDFTCHDASGLSYDNRSSTRGILALLAFAEARPWGRTLRSTLPRPGTGTLGHPTRLGGLTLRAKTGTLENASALSGWVRSEIDGRWLEFSILSNAFDDQTAKGIEDEIVRLIAAEATDPTP